MQVLWWEVQWWNVIVVEDLDCYDVLVQMMQFIDKVDKIYLIIDFDVLFVWEMLVVFVFVVLGVLLIQVLCLIELVCCSGKLQVVDLVEFNLCFDEDGVVVCVVVWFGW